MMRSNRKLQSGAVILVLIAFFVVVNVTGFSKGIRNFVYSFSSPLQGRLWEGGANISNFFGSVFDAGSLKAENENLKNENWKLSSQIASLQSAESENETLREAMNLGLNKEFRLAMAQVVAKDVNSDVLSINKGSRDGLAPGMPVISGEKQLIGKINEVYSNYSKVELITNSDFSFGAEIASSSILGEARGEGDLEMSLDQIPQTQKINQGDLVLSTSLGGTFPDGLFVGKVSSITKSDTNSFQQAEVDPAFDLNSLSEVFVIINF